MRDEDRPPVLAHQMFAAHRAALSGLDIPTLFTRIHEMNLWGAATSRSGLGSEMEAASVLVEGLPSLLQALDAGSLLDAPCGDANWINFADLRIDYVGVDIVPELIERLNARAHAGEVRGAYRLADITTDALPPAQAILCRDCLVHFSFPLIAQTIENFRRTGATWLIATTFTRWDTNKECENGDWRPLNMQQPPFSWPAPTSLLNERCGEAGGAYDDKCLGAWRLADLPAM